MRHRSYRALLSVVFQFASIVAQDCPDHVVEPSSYELVLVTMVALCSPKKMTLVSWCRVHACRGLEGNMLYDSKRETLDAFSEFYIHFGFRCNKG